MKWIMYKKDKDIFQMFYNDETDKPIVDDSFVFLEEGEEVEENNEPDPFDPYLTKTDY